MYDVFEYVAANNPQGVHAIISKYGYTVANVQTAEDLGEVFRGIVNEVGMPAMKDLIAIHPDYELIAEDAQAATGNKNAGGCGCGGDCKKKSKSVAQEYLGGLQQTTGVGLQQGNLFLIGAALILAVAIVSK